MTLEELKLNYPIGTTFKVIKDYKQAKIGDIVKLTKYSDIYFAYFSNDDYEDVPLYLPHYSTPEVELYEVNEFKKGDYIVLLDTLTTDTSFPKNHIFKQRQNHHYLLSELDISGSKANGWCLVNFSKKDCSTNYNWRYATPEEIDMYNFSNKPFDVTTLQTEKPVEKSLVGRYLKAKVDNPWSIRNCKKNDYLIITDSNHCYVINDKNKTEWTFANDYTNGLPHSDFELMPEGFYPDQVKEEWVPKVGDWIYLIKSYRNLPIGTVAKINDSDVCPLSNPEESCFCISNYVGFACMPFKSHCRKAEPHEIPVNEPTEVTKSSMNKSQAIEYFKQFNIVEGTRYISNNAVRDENLYINKADERWNFVERHTTGEEKAITRWLDCGARYLWYESNPHLAIIIPDYVECNSKIYYVEGLVDFDSYKLKSKENEKIIAHKRLCNPLWQYNGKSFDEIISKSFKKSSGYFKWEHTNIYTHEEPVKQKVNKTNRLEMLPLKQMQIL